MDNFLPNIYQKSIYTIDYKKLKKSGIRCLVFGLNNTIAPLGTKVPTKRLQDLFEDLKEMGFKLIILSNSKKSRVEPFKEYLNVDSAYYSYKPLKKKYKRIMHLYGFKETEIACIGNQLITDVYGANRMKFTSILVNSISSIDYASTKLIKFIDSLIINKLTKSDRIKRGQYYE